MQPRKTGQPHKGWKASAKGKVFKGLSRVMRECPSDRVAHEKNGPPLVIVSDSPKR